MFSKHIWIAAVLALTCSSASLALNKPVQGQAPAGANQTKSPTANNDTSRQERKMQDKLQSMYESGKLDADAVASYQQRLDEMKANEEELRAQGGMNAKATKDFLNKLDEMDRQLTKDAQDQAKAPKNDSSYSSTDKPTSDFSTYSKQGDPSESSSYAKSSDN